MGVWCAQGDTSDCNPHNPPKLFDVTRKPQTVGTVAHATYTEQSKLQAVCVLFVLAACRVPTGKKSKVSFWPNEDS
jgi:hypothetical protein